LGADIVTTQFIQNGKYDATEFDGEWIILNTDNYTVTKLNEVGGICWSLLNEAQTVDTLSQSLIREMSFETSIEEVKKDVQEFLSHLVECGLIQNVDRS
jgi:hypothetical protein